MNNQYINIYNNLINLTRNKELYKNFEKQDIFSDRLIFFMLHFAFFLKNFKKNEKKNTMQDIYDFVFRQLELSIREIGYGDQSINKKMKTYINTFYSMLDKIHNWEKSSLIVKKSVLLCFLDNKLDENYLVNYFDNYTNDLLNNSLNSYTKGVIKQ
tara:strand:+ start:567 stop:1034 length:468 start_codon:yes stop_codon:yes gene_type:complete